MARMRPRSERRENEAASGLDQLLNDQALRRGGTYRRRHQRMRIDIGRIAWSSTVEKVPIRDDHRGHVRHHVRDRAVDPIVPGIRRVGSLVRPSNWGRIEVRERVALPDAGLIQAPVSGRVAVLVPYARPVALAPGSKTLPRAI